MKFLVLWRLELARVHEGAVKALMRMPEYTAKLREQGKLVERYHWVGKHGGAWIYQVDSNEELERLLAMSPVYSVSNYDVYPLADMESPDAILNEQA